MKQEVLELLRKSTQSSISGAEIAEMLGVSRAAVWKSVDALRKDGYRIDAVTNKGYRLENANEIINLKQIDDYLTSKILARSAELIYETESTNNLTKERAKCGYAEGYLVLAEKQSAGKGRQGRSFYSPIHSGIYMSMVLRPNMSAERTSIITIMAAVAVCETLRSLYRVDAKIKWVNDIYIGNQKICGILTEAGFEVESGKLEYAVLGIGINVFAAELPEELSEIVTFLSVHTDRSINVNEMIAHVWNRFEKYYTDDDFSEVLDFYRKESMVLGKQVSFEKDGVACEAMAVDVDDHGGLVVRYSNGTDETLRSGEISIRVIK